MGVCEAKVQHLMTTELFVPILDVENWNGERVEAIVLLMLK
jgi:hypothetical protein